MFLRRVMNSNASIKYNQLVRNNRFFLKESKNPLLVNVFVFFNGCGGFSWADQKSTHQLENENWLIKGWDYCFVYTTGSIGESLLTSDHFTLDHGNFYSKLDVFQKNPFPTWKSSETYCIPISFILIIELNFFLLLVCIPNERSEKCKWYKNKC